MSTVTGVEGEERNDFNRAESKQIRQRSIRLLGSLLRPLRTRVTLTIVVVVVSTAFQVAGPALIAYGIDTGLPRLLKQDWLPLGLAVAGYLTAGIAGAVLIAWYTVLTARISQAILIDLRKRVFRHTQRLSLEFHESYTSGRIIARQTSDLDSIRELLRQRHQPAGAGRPLHGVHRDRPVLAGLLERAWCCSARSCRSGS